MARTKAEAEDPIEGQEVVEGGQEQANGQTQTNEQPQPDATPVVTPTTEETPADLLAELRTNGVITMSAQTNEQLQDEALAFIAANPGTYVTGAASYDMVQAIYTIKIKLKEEE